METEVSRQLWANLKAVRPTLPDDHSSVVGSPTMNHPVESSWYEAVLFANLLSLRNGYTRCYYTDSGFTNPITSSNYTTGPFFCDFDATGYRLPTEGEWEYFTRAGTMTPFSCNEPNYPPFWQDCEGCPDYPTLSQYCVYCFNSPRAVVGSKLPNPWNLKDVHGNMYEWCWDWYGFTYPSGSATNYTGPFSGTERVMRSSSADSPVWTSAQRPQAVPGMNYDGFRLVRTFH